MYSAIDTMWVLVALVLMFMMQAGFAMMETGLTRAKNAGNIAMKNLLDLVVGVLAYWVLGFGLMHNTSGNGFIGIPDLFSRGNYSTTIPTAAYIAFQMMFCATAATIVSGAMAERTRFQAYLIYSAIISGFIYPITGYWAWNADGWLARMGFHDFAGSTVVHVVGGMSALVGAQVLGPRIGKYTQNGKSKAIPGQNMTYAILGIFLLWFGWYGFNAGSTLGMEGDEKIIEASQIVLNVTICAATSGITALCTSWYRYAKPDIPLTVNGVLAGLVAITAGCDQVSAVGACLIGLISGYVVVFAVSFVDNVLKVDDPVGAVAAHGICGMLGTILTGVFSTENGFLYTGRFEFFGVEILGTVVIAAWTWVVMQVVFRLIKLTCGLRVSKEDEMRGLDESQHGWAHINTVPQFGEYETPIAEDMEAAYTLDQIDPSKLPEKYKTTDGKIRKVVVVMNQNRLERLMKAMDRIDITGITVTNVSGCGTQRGNTAYYHGSEFESHLLPKVKVEIVICTVPLALLIDTIKNAIYTGNIGDGKIFIYDVTRVIKVRTGAEGKEALE